MYAEQFKRDGVAVIPLFTLEETKALKEEFRKAIFDLPEFKDPKLTETEAHSMGGFCALGTGSSFHHPFIRKLRLTVFQRALPKLWDDLIGDESDKNLELLIDRALYRPTTRKVTPESWHQDKPDPKVLRNLAMTVNPEDITCGGWLNLDSFDQFFNGLKGTQHDKFGADGFARIPKEKLPHYKAMAKQQGKIAIPPGCLIVFYESIVHNVTSNKMKHALHRQFFGWRITKDTKPLFPDTLVHCKHQWPIRLKSGQEPPMYSRMHLANWIERVEAWSKNVRDEYCYDHTVKSGKNEGKTFRICHRFLKTVHLNSARYPPHKHYPNYTRQELAILTPARRWSIGGTAIKIQAAPEVRDVTNDIQFEEQQKKRAAEVDLTKKTRKKRRVA